MPSNALKAGFSIVFTRIFASEQLTIKEMGQLRQINTMRRSIELALGCVEGNQIVDALW